MNHEDALRRLKSMANHPSRQLSFRKWEEQFQEMDKDDEALGLTQKES